MQMTLLLSLYSRRRKRRRCYLFAYIATDGTVVVAELDHYKKLYFFIS
jgi:hypothetical protein